MVGNEQIQRHVLRCVRRMFHDRGEIAPHALLFADMPSMKSIAAAIFGELGCDKIQAAVSGDDDQEVGMYYIPARFDDGESKAEFAAAVRALAYALDAWACAFVAESWTSTDPKSQAHMRRGRSLETFPGRREVVFVSVEHADYKGARCYTAEIERRADCVRLAPWSDHESAERGRFANLLPGAGSN